MAPSAIASLSKNASLNASRSKIEARPALENILITVGERNNRSVKIRGGQVARDLHRTACQRRSRTLLTLWSWAFSKINEARSLVGRMFS